MKPRMSHARPLPAPKANGYCRCFSARLALIVDGQLRPDGSPARRRIAGRRAAGSTSPSGTASAASRARRRRSHADLASRASRSAAISPKWSRCCRAVKAKQFLLDGELILPLGDALSFEALQLRLHPAESRIRKLSRRNTGRADAVRPAVARRQVAADQPLCEAPRGAGALLRQAARRRRSCCRRHRASGQRRSAGSNAAAERSTASSPSASTSPTSPASGR